MTTPNIARPSRKLRIPVALRSFCSNSGCFELSRLLTVSSFMCRFQNLPRMRVVQGQQRPPFQIAEEIRQPQASDPDWDDYVPHRYMELRMESRLDHPEQIHEPHEHQPHCQPDQRPHIALELTRKQKYERDGKVERCQKQSH